MGSLEDTKDLRVGTRLKTLMALSGLEEVDVRMLPLPLCAWSNGKYALVSPSFPGPFLRRC